MYDRLGKKGCIVSALIFGIIVTVITGTFDDSNSASRICARSNLAQEEWTDMVGTHSAELRSGAYIPIARRREMADEENVRQENALRSKNTCDTAIEYERSRAEYSALNKHSAHQTEFPSSREAAERSAVAWLDSHNSPHPTTYDFDSPVMVIGENKEKIVLMCGMAMLPGSNVKQATIVRFDPSSRDVVVSGSIDDTGTAEHLCIDIYFRSNRPGAQMP